MLITANTVDEIVEANQEGADECLVKPVNPGSAGCQGDGLAGTWSTQ